MNTNIFITEPNSASEKKIERNRTIFSLRWERERLRFLKKSQQKIFGILFQKKNITSVLEWASAISFCCTETTKKVLGICFLTRELVYTCVHKFCACNSRFFENICKHQTRQSVVFLKLICIIFFYFGVGQRLTLRSKNCRQGCRLCPTILYVNFFNVQNGYWVRPSILYWRWSFGTISWKKLLLLHWKK